MKWNASTARRVGITIGLARTGIGMFMLSTPASLPAMFGADPAVGPGSSWITRMVGWREIALGGGGALALSRGQPATLWLLGQVMVDVGDSIAFRAASR